MKKLLLFSIISLTLITSSVYSQTDWSTPFSHNRWRENQNKPPADEPFQFSATPTVNSQSTRQWPLRHNFSLNLTIGSVFEIRGFELGLFANSVANTMTGLQVAGIANVVQMQTNGVQFATIANYSDLKTYGLQASLVYNYSESLTGVQVGMFNQSKTSSGIQIGGINFNQKELSGAQIGVGNYSQGYAFSQIGYGNLATGVVNYQMGLVNIADQAENMQIGVLNIADNNSGFSFGLLNLIRKGQHSLEVSTTESGLTFLSFRNGSKFFHVIYEVGLISSSNYTAWTPGVGLGFRYPMNEFNLSYDIIFNKINQSESWTDGLHAMLRNRVQLTYDIYRNLRVFGAVSLNVYASKINDGDGLARGEKFVDPVEDNWYRYWIGFQVGVGFF